MRYAALVALALLPFAAATAAAAPAPAPILAEQDGLKFEYRTQLLDGGKVILDGRMLQPREDFTFVVERDGYVHGEVGDRTVDFTISRKDHDALMAEIQNDQGLALADLTAGH